MNRYPQDEFGDYLNHVGIDWRRLEQVNAARPSARYWRQLVAAPGDSWELDPGQSFAVRAEGGGWDGAGTLTELVGRLQPRRQIARPPPVWDTICTYYEHQWVPVVQSDPWLRDAARFKVLDRLSHEWYREVCSGVYSFLCEGANRDYDTLADLADDLRKRPTTLGCPEFPPAPPPVANTEPVDDGPERGKKIELEIGEVYLVKFADLAHPIRVEILDIRPPWVSYRGYGGRGTWYKIDDFIAGIREPITQAEIEAAAKTEPKDTPS